MPLSPEQRAKFASFLNEVTTKSNDTKTKKERANEFDRRIGYKTPTTEIAAKIESAERVVWIPCSYVLFARKSTCRNCGASERCLDVPQLFLQKRKERRDASNPYLYEAVREIEFSSLPKRIILQVKTTPFCLECFECHTNSSNSSQADTESHTGKTAQIHTLEPAKDSPLLALVSPSSSHVSSLWNTPLVASAGLPSETAFGLECGEREFALRVDAEG